MSPNVPIVPVPFNDLPPRALHVAVQVAQGRTVGEIAESLKLHRKTVSRLKGDQRFAKLVRDLQAATIERSASILVHARVRAANTLVALLDSPNAAIALRAATTILGNFHDPTRV